MSGIHVHIERLVIDPGLISRGQGRDLGDAVVWELTRLLAGGGGGTIAELGSHRQALGADIAGSVARQIRAGIGSVGGGALWATPRH